MSGDRKGTYVEQERYKALIPLYSLCYGKAWLLHPVTATGYAWRQHWEGAKNPQASLASCKYINSVP